MIEKGETKIINAKHPLLDRKTAVPVTITIGGDHDTVIITGPNTGGKTVSIKTLGLLTAMAQCGIHENIDISIMWIPMITGTDDL